MKSIPIFGFPIPIFPIQYTTFTELSLTMKGVSYSLPCKIIALFTPLKNGSRVKMGKIWPPLQTDPKGTLPPWKHIFGCTEQKSTPLRVSCGRVKETKKWKKHARTKSLSYAQPPPHLRRPPYFACGSDGWRKQTYLISGESVQGFRSSRGRKWQSCYTVMMFTVAVRLKMGCVYCRWTY